MKEDRFFADDRPVDYGKYLEMTEEELEDEIDRLEREQELKESHEKQLVNV